MIQMGYQKYTWLAMVAGAFIGPFILAMARELLTTEDWGNRLTVGLAAVAVSIIASVTLSFINGRVYNSLRDEFEEDYDADDADDAEESQEVEVVFTSEIERKDAR